jgi:hypothetical protein
VTPPFAHGTILRVRIEVPRGSWTKRKADGRVDLRGLPCPYNYGSVLDTAAPDGDPYDAIVLGPRRAFGDVVEVAARGLVAFEDAGVDDPKLVCSRAELSAWQRRGVLAFFVVYAAYKRARQRVAGRRGATRSHGWRVLPGPPAG